ncbi:hypothetical protein Tco_0486882 [Tanacetum coccineum]
MTIDPQCSSHPSTSFNAIKAHFKEATISQTSLRQPEIEIEPQQPEEPEPTLKDEFQDLHLNLPVLEVLAHAPIYNDIPDKYIESLELGKNRSTFHPRRRSGVNIIPLYLFKKLNIRLLEETDHIFGIADGTKSYPVGIVKDIEVHIGKLKLLNDFYVITNEKDPENPLLSRDGAWHAKIRLIDPEGEEFTKTLQSIPTTRKLSERERLREIITLHHFYDTSIRIDNPRSGATHYCAGFAGHQTYTMSDIGMLRVNEARDPVMSSSSTVTYTFVYTDSEPGRVFLGADEEMSNRGDDDDEPSDDDDDDDDTDDEDEEPFEDEDDDEEEEHLAPADSSAMPVVDPVPLARDTEAFETDESAPTPRSPQTKIPSPPLPPPPSSLHLPPPVPTSLPLLGVVVNVVMMVEVVVVVRESEGV